MSTAHDTRPGCDRPGVQNSLPIADIITLAWQTGRDYVSEGLAEAYDDAVHASIQPPVLDHEERVQRRLREMEEFDPAPFLAAAQQANVIADLVSMAVGMPRLEDREAARDELKRLAEARRD